MLLRAVALALVVLPAGGTIDGLWATSVASACFRDPEPPASLLPKDKFFKQLAGPEQRAVRLLGWTATSWDGGDPSPMENKFWGAWLEPARGARATLLSAEERSAAEILGFRSQKLWDHGISNGVIDELEASLLAAVQQQDCTPGWDQPVLRGLLSKPSDGIKGLDRARVWVEAATRHYVEAALAALPDTGGQRAVVNLTDSWLSVGKPQEWRGAAVAAHPRSDIVGHLFISCPSATATCQLQLMDPRPRAHALTTNNFVSQPLVNSDVACESMTVSNRAGVYRRLERSGPRSGRVRSRPTRRSSGWRAAVWSFRVHYNHPAPSDR